MSAGADVKVLTSRIGHEFTLDDLRLIMLSANAVMQNIVEAFQFRALAITTPQATFGPVPTTLPAGLVFQTGSWISPVDSQIIPIRFLHVELQRIVIDIAGP